MAIIATYTEGNLKIERAYVKLTRIWLSVEEGFNSYVEVKGTKSDITPIIKFSVNVPYQDGANPFTVLYEHIKTLPMFSDVVSDVGQVEVVEAKPLPKKSKK